MSRSIEDYNQFGFRVEIVVVVEGLDPATGAAVQARHSYTFDEVLWDLISFDLLLCKLHEDRPLPKRKYHSCRGYAFT